MTIKNKIRKIESALGKKNIVIGLLLLAILLLYLIFRIWLKLYFIFGEDLIIKLEPNDLSFNILYNDKQKVDFKIELEKSLFCESRCAYKFADLSESELIDVGNSSIERKKSVSRRYELSVDKIGTGQKLYRFDVSCKNIKTYLCPTNEKIRERSGFVTLNYDISEFEKLLKSQLKQNLTQTLGKLQVLDVKMQEFNSRFFDLGFQINLQELFLEKEILNNEYSNLLIEIENLRNGWSSQNYTFLFELYNKGYDGKINYLSSDLSELAIELNEILGLHNKLTNESNELDLELRSFNDSLDFLSNINETSLIIKHNLSINGIGELKAKILQNSFSNYTYLNNELLRIKEAFDKIKNDTMKLYTFFYTSGFYSGVYEKDILCETKGLCINHDNISSISTKAFSIDNAQLVSFCHTLNDLKDIYSAENNKSEEALNSFLDKNKTIEIANKIKSKISYSVKKKYYYELLNVSAENSFQQMSFELIKNQLVGLNINSTINDEDFFPYSKQDIFSVIKINSSNINNFYPYVCIDKNKINLSEYYPTEIKLDIVKLPESGNFKPRINIELKEHFPICCIFNDCKKCCSDNECLSDESLYPVLFLHGHAFNSDNSPDYSLDAFNKLVAELEKDGYINAGTITPKSDFSEVSYGDWGLLPKPISVKGSYYLVSYYNVGGYSLGQQKSENIETYAIRLKELIELLKYRTSRKKIIIISHSMGSLVVRSYLEIFGDSSVHKVIMIAPPNKGISGSITEYCPLLGEKKECKDMSKNSIFIKKLNDPSKIPEDAKIYAIIGSGCTMEDGIGDGIVLKESAELDYVKNYYINGTCSQFSLLHTEILDIEKYPEVYESIKNALKE